MTQYFRDAQGTMHEFPDDATPEEIDAATRDLGKPKPKPPVIADLARATFDESPWYQKALIGAGGELKSLGRGIGQIFTPNDSQTHKNLTAAADQDRAFQSGVHGVAGFAGRALPYLATAPLSAPEAIALRAAPAAGTLGRLAIKAGVAAAEGAGYGALQQVGTGESRGENAGFGALGGIAGRGIAGGLGKAVAVARNKWADPAMQEVSEYLTSKGIPVSLGDLGSNSARFIENRLASMFGSGRREVLQQQAHGIEGEATSLANAFRQQREQVAGMSGLPDASPEEMVAGGIRRQYQANKKASSAKYDEVSNAARTAPTVEARGTQGAVQQALADAPEVFTGFGSANRTWLDWLGVGGKPHLGFDDLRGLRKEVANAEAAAQRRIATGNATTATQNEALQLGRVRSAIESDMESWAQKSGGDVLDKYRAANAFHRENVVPYRSQPETRPYIKADANPDRIGSMLNANRPEAANRVMGATDPAGRAAAKELVVSRALDRATNPARDNLSVFQLLSGLNTGKAGKAIFDPAEQAAIDKVGGVAKLLSRAAQAGSDPATGQFNMALGQMAFGGAAGGYVSDNPTLGTLGGVVAGLALPRAANRATYSALAKRLVMSGLPAEIADSVAYKLITGATRKGITSGAASGREQPLELDVAGGRRATAEDIARDKALVGY
jgi:hypothetical protein